MYLFLGPSKTFLRVVNVGHQQRSMANGMAFGKKDTLISEILPKTNCRTSCHYCEIFHQKTQSKLCPSHSKLLLLFLKLIFFTCSGLQACSLLWFQHVCSCSVYFRLNNWLQPASVCNRLLTSSRKNASRNSHATTSKNEGTQYLTSFRTAKLTM